MQQALAMLVVLPFLKWIPLLNKKVVKKDIIAGVVAGVLILPQAIALATIAGMPPEYGLYTSIFPVIIASIFGSSWQALSGPNTALVIMIAMAVSPYASIGTPDYIMYVLTLTFMVGAIQMFFAIFKLGIVFNYFSQTVMIALVTGVGIIIILQQIGNFLGIVMNILEDIEDVIYQLFHSVYMANPYALSAGLMAIISGVIIRRYFPKLPYLIISIVVGTITAKILDLMFGYGVTDIDKLGNLTLSILPLSAPDFSPENFAEAAEGLILAAFVIALMGLIQSTVIARSMAIRTGQNVSLNQEVAAQGLSNILGSFMSCFPSCGSFNRSVSNLETGAVTPLAGVVSAFILALLVFLAAPIVSEMPIAVMAGVLILVGANLIKISDIKKLLLTHGESKIIFLLVLGTTLYGGLQNGVFLGIFLSIAMYLKSISKPDIEFIFDLSAERYLHQNDKNATVIRISGSLFFGSVKDIEIALNDIASQDKRQATLVVAGEYIHDLDKSAAYVFYEEALKRKKSGGGFRIWLRNHKFDLILNNEGLIDLIGKENISYVSDLVKSNKQGEFNES